MLKFAFELVRQKSRNWELNSVQSNLLHFSILLQQPHQQKDAKCSGLIARENTSCPSIKATRADRLARVVRQLILSDQLWHQLEPIKRALFFHYFRYLLTRSNGHTQRPSYTRIDMCQAYECVIVTIVKLWQPSGSIWNNEFGGLSLKQTRS